MLWCLSIGGRYDYSQALQTNAVGGDVVDDVVSRNIVFNDEVLFLYKKKWMKRSN